MNLSSGSKWFIYCFFSSIKLFVKSKPIQKPNNFVGVNILIKFIPFFLCQQNERLRLVLQEQRKQDLAVLLSNVESKTTSLIRRKEEDLAQATMRTMELQECLKKAEMESETWQRIARANEAMVTDLNNTLEQVRERLVLVKRSSRKITCKRCYSRSSCVLFLPCRHLCSCKNCEAFLGSCPVCNAVKEGSIEVFLV
jgi:E3 ubiquitin-protein ligase BOI-like protein